MEKAVLVIDMQPIFLHDLSNRGFFIERVRRVINSANRFDIPVFYAEQTAEGYNSKDQEKNLRTYPCLGRRENDKRVIEKESCDAFFGTGLEEILANTRNLILMGVYTGMCFKSTLYSALKSENRRVLMSIDTTADCNQDRYDDAINEFCSLYNVDVVLSYHDLIKKMIV